MAENENDAPLTHVEQGMLYAGGDLSPTEAAEYEKHLATCAECQANVAKAKAVLPMASAMLAFKPKRTVEEQVARFDAMRQAKRKRDLRKRVGLAVLVAIGAVAAGWWLMQRRPAPLPAPMPPLQPQVLPVKPPPLAAPLP